MKRTSQFITLCITILITGISCRQDAPGSNIVRRIGDARSLEETAPFLTTDNNGNAVLCWTSKDPQDSLNRLMYAVYDEDKDMFGEPVVVSVSAGTKSSAESMNKIAFKADGTVMAVFAKRFKNEKNPSAGAICYSMSSDSGLSWSPALYIHSDTLHNFGRNYFDVSALKNGEIGAIWLDGRFKDTIKGSAIFFSQTQKGGGFKGDTCINKNTCECCRTDLLTDKDGNIHIAYRSITYPEALMGKQARDIVYTQSKDNGKTFSPEQVISKDNWIIEGCPHTGPSMAVNKSGVNAVWFTAAGSTGLYHSSRPAAGTAFNGRDLLTARGRHPQLVSLADGRLVMVCEENEDAEGGDHKASKAAEQSHTGMSHHSPSDGVKVVLRVMNGDKIEKTIPLTDGKSVDHHPVIIPVRNGLITAWVREEDGKSGVYFSRIRSL